MGRDVAVPAATSTRAEHVHGALRAEILAGRLAPGTRLRLVELAERFSVSQSVVREALTRLAGQEIVVALPQQGFRVASLTLDDLTALTEARMHIEGLVLRLAVQRGDVAWEASAVAAHHRLLRSKGIHVLVPAMTRGHAVTVAAGPGHFFVLPWHGHTLLGTTDTAFKSAPDAVSVGEGDIDDFFALINKYLPAAKLTRGAVEHFYAGLRPLVDDGSGDTYGASRRAELVDHGADDGLDGLFSAIGGKWTTSRDLAQSVVDTIVEKLGLKAAACETDEEPTAGGDVGRFGDFLTAQKKEHGDLPTLEHLAHMYGTRLPDMLAEANNRPELRAAVGTAGDIGAQVLFAVREEMALTLADVVMRRTCMGQVGAPPREALETASRIMAAELGWDDERRTREIQLLNPTFATREAA